MRALLLAASLAAAAAVLASAAPENSSLAKGFIVASPGASCAATCEAAGKSVAKFAEFNAGASPAQTAVCAIKSNDKEGWVPGWQPVGGAAPADCNVALNLNATAAARDVACLCLEGGEVQGLDLPARGKPCAKACGKSITGRAGRPVAAGAGGAAAGYACLSLPTEIGVRQWKTEG